MTNVRFDQITEKTRNIMTRLNKLGLESDKRMMQTLLDNSQYTNRLISLFDMLKKCNIKLHDTLYDIVATNVSYASTATDLLKFIHEKKIDVTLIPLELVFHAAKSEATLPSIRNLSPLDLVTLKLILSYPEQSSLLADLIINFQKHAYSTEKIVEKLHKFSAKNMNTVIELLRVLLDKNLYYLGCLDVFLKQQQYIDRICEGTKKLAAADILDPCYFQAIEQDASNANLLANIMLLLQAPPLLDYRKKEDLLLASKLGVGAFHFLTHLHQVGLLNEVTYQKVCQNNLILGHPDVIDSLCKLPLFTKFAHKELGHMLALITSKDHLNDFIEAIQVHHLTSKVPSC
jgi:hypothetical protein